jgi:two-component system sensor histidine kinase KdpD
MATRLQAGAARSVPSEVPLADAMPHVLVCISGSQDDLRLMQQGALLARRLAGRLTALYVLSPPARPRPSEVLRADRVFARSLGVALVETPAASVVDGITEYALERGVTQIVLSEAVHTPWYTARHGSLVDDLARRLADVEIFVLGSTRLGRQEARKKPVG